MGLGEDASLTRYVRNAPYDYTDPTGMRLATPKAILSAFLPSAVTALGNATSLIGSAAQTLTSYRAPSVSRAPGISLAGGNDNIAKSAGVAVTRPSVPNWVPKSFHSRAGQLLQSAPHLGYNREQIEAQIRVELNVRKGLDPQDDVFRAHDRKVRQDAANPADPLGQALTLRSDMADWMIQEQLRTDFTAYRSYQNYAAATYGPEVVRSALTDARYAPPDMRMQAEFAVDSAFFSTAEAGYILSRAGVTAVRNSQAIRNFLADEAGTVWLPGENGRSTLGTQAPNTRTGAGYSVNDPPVRIQGEWTDNDLKQALLGHPPRGLGSPDLHHAGQMPGSGIHEILPGQHRTNTVLHPNRYNQGVTPEMRAQDRQLHWWYRAREQGADQRLPNWIYDND